jgi:hypothetical protein
VPLADAGSSEAGRCCRCGGRTSIRPHFWTIPGEFVKNAHGHRVYLNETARKVLDDVPRDDDAVWVFPKSRMGDSKHVGRHGLSPIGRYGCAACHARRRWSSTATQRGASRLIGLVQTSVPTHFGS